MKVRIEWVVREVSELVVTLALVVAFVYVVGQSGIDNTYKGLLGGAVTMAATFYFGYRAAGKPPLPPS